MVKQTPRRPWYCSRLLMTPAVIHVWQVYLFIVTGVNPMMCKTTLLQEHRYPINVIGSRERSAVLQHLRLWNCPKKCWNNSAGACVERETELMFLVNGPIALRLSHWIFKRTFYISSVVHNCSHRFGSSSSAHSFGSIATQPSPAAFGSVPQQGPGFGQQGTGFSGFGPNRGGKGSYGFWLKFDSNSVLF